MTQINQDGLTRDEIETALDVLSETFQHQVGPDDGAAVATTKGLVREYAQDSTWRDEQPADTVDPDDYQQLGTIGDG